MYGTCHQYDIIRLFMTIRLDIKGGSQHLDSHPVCFHNKGIAFVAGYVEKDFAIYINLPLIAFERDGKYDMRSGIHPKFGAVRQQQGGMFAFRYD